MADSCQNATENPNILLITANVGSIFEKPDCLLDGWLRTLLLKIEALRPHFLAIHLQEVGGKSNGTSIENVHNFIETLCDAEEMRNYKTVRVYIDEDFNSAENYTALGNLYLIHQDLKDVQDWNFSAHKWQGTEARNIYYGNIESVATKDKAKFPKHFFPQCKLSRKGFMRTRWQINGIAFDLVNIHLFHDASNLAACQEYPSLYLKTRRMALAYTLERLYLDQQNGYVGFFLFGDFNFRCDTHGVIQELTQGLTTHRIQKPNNENSEVFYKNSNGDNILTVGKKQFYHADHQLKFKENWLKKFDREIEPLDKVLIEYPIMFHPSYPFEEDNELPEDYMTTRCPAWCDRILMSPQAKEIISDLDITNSYNMIGYNICMGDHKPIYLNFRLKSKKEIQSKPPQLPDNVENILNEIQLEVTVWQEKMQQDTFKNWDVHQNYIQMSSPANLKEEDLVWKQHEDGEQFDATEKQAKNYSELMKETSV